MENGQPLGIYASPPTVREWHPRLRRFVNLERKWNPITDQWNIPYWNDSYGVFLYEPPRQAYPLRTKTRKSHKNRKNRKSRKN